MAGSSGLPGLCAPPTQPPTIALRPSASVCTVGTRRRPAPTRSMVRTRDSAAPRVTCFIQTILLDGQLRRLLRQEVLLREASVVPASLHQFFVRASFGN